MDPLREEEPTAHTPNLMQPFDGECIPLNNQNGVTDEGPIPKTGPLARYTPWKELAFLGQNASIQS